VEARSVKGPDTVVAFGGAMAQMIPDALPPGRSQAEGLVFSRLQLLPDDCLVYYEPAVADRYPDFVVILPDTGLLVIEVKGWRPYQIVAGSSHSIQFQERAGAPEEARAIACCSASPARARPSCCWPAPAC
jgi:hypothetical protein